MLNHDQQRKSFIHELAVYLADNQAAKGIAIQMERPAAPVKWASEWAKVRGASPIFGYPTVEETEKQLTDFFNQPSNGDTVKPTS